jgi:hypothetical protein
VTDRQSDPTQEPSGVIRFIGIVGAFVLIGPPIGGAVLWTLLGSVSVVGYGELPPHAGPTLGLLMLYGYPLGAPFALAAGVIHAVAAIGWRQSSVWLPITAGVTVAIGGSLLFVLVKRSIGSAVSEFLTAVLLVLPPSVGASLVCWRVARPMLRPA